MLLENVSSPLYLSAKRLSLMKDTLIGELRLGTPSWEQTNSATYYSFAPKIW